MKENREMKREEEIVYSLAMGVVKIYGQLRYGLGVFRRLLACGISCQVKRARSATIIR